MFQNRPSFSSGFVPGKKNRYLRPKIIIVIGILFFTGVTWWWQVGVARVVAKQTVAGILNLANWQDRSLPGVLQTYIPLMGKINLQGKPKTTNYPTLRVPFSQLIGARIKEPATFLASQIPMLNYLESTHSISQIPKEKKIAPPTRKVPEQSADNKPLNLGDKPLILIYSSHTGESYEATDGVSRLTGKRGGVYQAAKEIAQRLEKVYGVKVIHAQDIFDNDYKGGLPYLKSGEMVSKVLKENPSIEMVVDVHRDASVSRENSVTIINGQKTARVMLVVGTNARSAHPNWMKNYAFAKTVETKIKALYPQLIRKVEAQRGRYNQHLHPRALLIEIGSDKNSTEEAVEGARLMADVLASVLKDLNGK